VSDLTMAYGTFVLMRDMTFTVHRGDVSSSWAPVGAARAPAATPDRPSQPAGARQHLLRGGLHDGGPDTAGRILRDVGVLFQGGALWSAMTLE
jgi:phospholipid/cholesterol/gamma-HCH transport system ATP-binding protein